jgi:fructokinase
MITVVGEALLDLVADGAGRSFAAHPGGSPANVAVGLARLDTPVRLATQLADDLPGRLITEHLRDSGVLVDVLPSATAATSLALASVDEAGVASYDFRLAWDISRGPYVDPRCVCLHTGSIAAAYPPGAEMVDRAIAEHRAAGLTISYDPNIRPSLIGPRESERLRVARQVASSDVVKTSAEDLEWLYPGEPLEAVAERWLGTGPALVVVTLGAKGAYAVSRAGRFTRPPMPVTVVDTVGAGDAFMAGLLDGLNRGGLLGPRTDLAAIDAATVTEVVDFATRVAGITCSRPGAQPPTRAEINASGTIRG